MLYRQASRFAARFGQYWKKPDGRYNALVIGFVALLAISFGCAVSLANRPVRGGSYEQRFADEIFALATLRGVTLPEVGSAPVLALLGKQQTYLLTTGGEKLLQINATLDQQQLQWLDVDRPIKIIAGVKHIRGSLVLRYRAPKPPTAPIRQQLRLLGFIEVPRDQSTEWTLAVAFKGRMGSAIPFSPVQMQGFRQRYPLAVSSYVRHAKPELETLEVLPLALIVRKMPEGNKQGWLPLLELQTGAE
jgi:hypothetical protein